MGRESTSRALRRTVATTPPRCGAMLRAGARLHLTRCCVRRRGPLPAPPESACSGSQRRGGARLPSRALDLIREFDARGGWNTGFRSCAEWLSWRVGLDLGAARQKVRVARALGGLPLLARALARGELSYAKVRALTRVATPQTEERRWRSGGPAPRSMSSASCAAGGGWTARPSSATPPVSTRAARCTWNRPVPGSRRG
jgi:hypothetical protein